MIRSQYSVVVSLRILRSAVCDFYRRISVMGQEVDLVIGTNNFLCLIESVAVSIVVVTSSLCPLRVHV